MMTLSIDDIFGHSVYFESKLIDEFYSTIRYQQDVAKCLVFSIQKMIIKTNRWAYICDNKIKNKVK